MFTKYLDDYYKFKITVKEISKKESVTPSTFHRWLKKESLLPRQKVFSLIKTNDENLKKELYKRYTSMLKRVKSKNVKKYGDYVGMEYLNIYDFVDFCNERMTSIEKVWESYLNDNSFKNTLSLDRINNDFGYLKENIQITTHGFNSWKRSVRPIKVTHKKEVNYFMTKEEASIFYGLRRQAIGEIANKKKYHLKGYLVEESSIDEVLKNNKIYSLQEYYAER